MPENEILIGNYLLDRLAQLGVTCMFGVPGDFNLGFLDLVEDHPTIDWIGNCNELGAAYAADGYARVKEGSLGVVLTTFGVGELSATNGIAGAFSEHVPVLHIVGVPNTAQQKAKPMLHHTLGDGRYDAYLKVSNQITIAQATLTDVQSAAEEIDRVIKECITTARPTYLMLPTDLAFAPLPPSSSLATRIKTPLTMELPPNDEEIEAFVLDQIESLVEKAFDSAVPEKGPRVDKGPKGPKEEGTDAVPDAVIVLLDACAIRHGVRAEVKQLLEVTNLPVYTSPMGKTAVSEEWARHGGIYVGSLSHPDIKIKVEHARLILSVGALKSDFNTGNFTYEIPPSRTIELHSDHTKVQHATYPNIRMKHLLPRLTARLARFAHQARALSVPKFELPFPEGTSESGKDNEEPITQEWLWPRVGKFFREKDVIVAETGTSSFGILEVPLPKDAVFVSQILWGSIGWTVGSTLGAALAARDNKLGRTILFIGDGSLQLMVQELSTMLRSGVKPIIFVLNNDGYTVERFLHGKDRKYNDIANWNWTGLLSNFNSTTYPVAHASHGPIRTPAELSALLDDAEFAKADKMQLVEVVLGKLDAPRALRGQAELSGKANVYEKPTTLV